MSNEFDQVLQAHFDKSVLCFFVNQSPIVVDKPKLEGCQADTFYIIDSYGPGISVITKLTRHYWWLIIGLQRPSTSSLSSAYCTGSSPRDYNLGPSPMLRSRTYEPGPEWVRGLPKRRTARTSTSCGGLTLESNIHRKSLLGCYETKQDFLFDDLTSSRSASVSLFAILSSFSKSKILAHIISGSMPLRKW